MSVGKLLVAVILWGDLRSDGHDDDKSFFRSLSLSPCCDPSTRGRATRRADPSTSLGGLHARDQILSPERAPCSAPLLGCGARRTSAISECCVPAPLAIIFFRPGVYDFPFPARDLTCGQGTRLYYT